MSTAFVLYPRIHKTYRAIRAIRHALLYFFHTEVVIIIDESNRFIVQLSVKLNDFSNKRIIEFHAVIFSTERSQEVNVKMIHF